MDGVSLGIALGIGMVIGAVGGAALIWSGMRWHERIVWGARENRPVFSEYDEPLEQGFTDEVEENTQ